jgi:gluconolactonase
MVRADSRELWQVLPQNVGLKRVAGGFQFTEGPVWHPDKQCLLFTDILGNTIQSWRHGALGVFRRPSNMANGLTLDDSNRLIACEHATSRLSRAEPDGEITILASHYEGRELNSPNDVVVGAEGWIYFTDPLSGRTKEFGVERPAALDFRGVFRVSSAGSELQLLAEDFDLPNGLCFSPAQEFLYVNDSNRMHIRRFACDSSGALIGSGEVFFEEAGQEMSADGGCPDGMKVDEFGNIYCTGPGGVWIIDANGRRLGVIETPAFAANLNWGGAEGRTLFITASDAVYTIDTAVRGGGMLRSLGEHP